jgi:hypothetical protein
MSTSISLTNISSMFTGWTQTSALYDMIQATSTKVQPSAPVGINVEVRQNQIPSSPGTYVSATDDNVYYATISISGDLSALSNASSIVTVDNFDVVYAIPLNLSQNPTIINNYLPDSVCSVTASYPFPSQISCKYMIGKFFRIEDGSPIQVGTMTSSYNISGFVPPNTSIDVSSVDPRTLLVYDFAVILTFDANNNGSLAIASNSALESIALPGTITVPFNLPNYQNNPQYQTFSFSYILSPVFPASGSGFVSNSYSSGGYVDPSMPSSYVFATMNSCRTTNNPGAVYSSLFTDMSQSRGALNYAEAFLLQRSSEWPGGEIAGGFDALMALFPASIVFVGYSFVFNMFVSNAIGGNFPTLQTDAITSLLNY